MSVIIAIPFKYMLMLIFFHDIYALFNSNLQKIVTRIQLKTRKLLALVMLIFIASEIVK